MFVLILEFLTLLKGTMKEVKVFSVRILKILPKTLTFKCNT